MRQTMAKAKSKAKHGKTKHEVRVRKLDDGKFLVTHHQEMDNPGMAGNYTPPPPPAESSHDTWKKAAKHIDGIFGPGDGAGGAAADSAGAPMPAETPDAEPSGGQGAQ